MTVPAPWNDKNKCFIYTNPDISDMLNKEEKEKMISINTNYTTYIRSNLAITDGENVNIPNIFEAINTAYNLIKSTTLRINEISTQIESIKEQIEELKPKQ